MRLHSGTGGSNAQKGGSRVYQQIIHNNGSGNILLGNTTPIGQQALLRRRVEHGQTIFSTGAIAPNGTTVNMMKAYQTPIFRQTEKEDFRNMYRNLKIQYNITRDENTRLRTQAKQMDVDLVKKEKDIENLTRQLQQQANYAAA